MATLPERPDFKAGYQAVYNSGALTHDVHRNAAVWHAVQAALKAALPSDAAILAAKADAWDEGYGDARGFYQGGPREPNPYHNREETAPEYGDPLTCADLGHEDCDGSHPDHIERAGAN